MFFCELRDTDKALIDANEAIRIVPSFDDAWAARGLIRLNLQDVGSALDDFNEAIRLSPNNFNALYYRGYIQCQFRNEYQAAEHDLTQAIRIAPKYGYAYLVRARARWHCGRAEQAEADYEKAIHLLPKCPPDAYVARAQYRKCQGFWDLAIADFSEAIRLSPETAALYLERANAFLRKGELLRAMGDCSEAIRLQPKNYVAYQSRATVLRKLGDKVGAMKDEQTVRELRMEEKHMSHPMKVNHSGFQL
jgi:tetratricopeptide (TPR) repeat protein